MTDTADHPTAKPTRAERRETRRGRIVAVLVAVLNLATSLVGIRRGRNPGAPDDHRS